MSEHKDHPGTARECRSCAAHAKTSESWRHAHLAWLAWSTELLYALGEQPDGGQLGDEEARKAISRRCSSVRAASAGEIMRLAREATECIDTCGLHGDELAGYLVGLLKEHGARRG